MQKEVLGTKLLSFSTYKSVLGKKKIITKFLKYFTKCNKQTNKKTTTFPFFPWYWAVTKMEGIEWT